MLKINNLKVEIDGKLILQGLNLEINKGEKHVIMGPNGAGKSTLSSVIIGNQNYNIIEGEIFFNNEIINNIDIDIRAKKGLFLSFQHPVEIEGVNNISFLKSSVNAIREYNQLTTYDSFEFMKLIKENLKFLDMGNEYTKRFLNVGFSGGEKKKNEILQLLMINPKLAILDEIDSGLDVDALKVVAKGINKYSNENNGLLLITHYQRLLNEIEVDYVHVLHNGKIIKTGDKNLIFEIEKNGYKNIINEVK